MQQRAKKVKRRSIWFAPISFLLIVAAVGFAMSVFFRVNNITVTGAERYTPEEIIEASGIQKGDNLFFINRGAAVARINARLPYVENAVVVRSLPNRLEIRVTESDAMAVVPSEEQGMWIIDRNCKLLNPVEGTDVSALITVKGLTAVAPEVGEVVAPGEDDIPKVNYLAAILRILSEQELRDQVTEIDVSSVSNPSFDFMQRFTVKLGSNENLDYKFSVLLSAVEKMTPGDRGTIDLSIDRRAHLTYN